MGCSCNKSKSSKKFSSPPLRNITKSSPPPPPPPPPKTVSAMTSQNSGMNQRRLEIEKKRRDAILRRMGKL